MIHLDTKALLTQIDHQVTDANVKAIEKVILNTKNFSKIEQHLIPFKDNLTKMDTLLTLSSSSDNFKIKIETTNIIRINEAIHFIDHWANKYNVFLEKKNDTTYYIIGVK